MKIEFEKRLRDIFIDVYMKGYDQARNKKELPDIKWLNELWKDAEDLVIQIAKDGNN